MEKERVNRGETYWYIYEDFDVHDCTDLNFADDYIRFKVGNYFRNKEEAETMVAKLRAVLNGADIIEMPDKDAVCQERENQLSNSVVDFDRWAEAAYRDGFEDCFSWLKTKIVK